MKGALVTFIVIVEGVAKEKFSGAGPQTPTSFAPPPIKIPGGATAYYPCKKLLKFITFILKKDHSFLTYRTI